MREKEREFLKYNYHEAKDYLGKQLKVGDIVVFNDYHSNTPIVGELLYFTQTFKCCLKRKDTVGILKYYRNPVQLIKLEERSTKYTQNESYDF